VDKARGLPRKKLELEITRYKENRIGGQIRNKIENKERIPLTLTDQLGNAVRIGSLGREVVRNRSRQR